MGIEKKGLIYIGISILIGWIAWSGYFWALPVSLLFPVLWTKSDNRITAILISFGYFLMGSRGLLLGTITYFQSGVWRAVLFWLIASALFMFPFGILWHRNKRLRIAALPLILLILSIPPIGIIAWGSPLPAAGIIFPNMGIIGLFFTVLLILLLSVLPLKGLIIFICILPVFGSCAEISTSIEHWQGIDTHYPYDLGRSDLLGDITRQQELIDTVMNSDSKVILFPEGVAGQWKSGTQQLWSDIQPELENKTVLIGASIPKGGNFENALIKITKTEQSTVYRQRIPIPIVMWNPWLKHSTTAHFQSDTLFELNGYQVTPLVCYETFITWTILQSIVGKDSDVLMAIGSTWWAQKTAIPEIQMTLLRSWARLFNLKLITAFNH